MFGVQWQTMLAALRRRWRWPGSSHLQAEADALSAAMQRHELGDYSYPLPTASTTLVGQVVAHYGDVFRAFVGTVERLHVHACKLYEAQAKIEEQRAELESQAEELRRSQAAAHDANQAKSEFLANMSHEMRTPLTAILGFAELLLHDAEAVDPAGRQELLERIRHNGVQLIGVVNDILDLAKIEAERLDIVPQPCCPQTLISEVLASSTPQARAKGIELSLRALGPLPSTIATDPLRLRQILTNLLGNAVKFTERGSVTVAVSLVNAWETHERKITQPTLQIDVIDTGLGMTPAQAKQIFQPFMQADHSIGRRFGGTGLGLVLSRRLAHLLGGNVVLVETAPGRGTTMRLTVSTGPLENVAIVESGQVVAQRQLAERQGKLDQLPPQCRVLLVEDSPDNQRLIAFVLRRAGAEVTLAPDGEEGVAQALAAERQARPFDVVLMDMQMPVLDGYAATTRLRQAGYTRPIIALTAHAMRGDHQKCLSAGCSDYSTKPIDRATLFATICRNLPTSAAVESTAAAPAAN